MIKKWLNDKGFRMKADQLYTALLIVLVGVGGFGIGRLSTIDEKRNDVRILSASAINSLESSEGGESEISTIVLPELEQGGKVVASKSGTKYHLPWCSGAKTIKEENKIWFDSYQDARAAGYLPAGNCKGIE